MTVISEGLLSRGQKVAKLVSPCHRVILNCAEDALHRSLAMNSPVSASVGFRKQRSTNYCFGHGASKVGNKVLYALCKASHNCFRDAKGYTGLMDCQTRDKWKLYFAFNASFTSLNVDKVTMKEMGMEYSMSSFKSLMTNTYLMRRIFLSMWVQPEPNFNQ